jgi:uncharacterized membrane protein YbhN (UPF0104 family)
VRHAPKAKTRAVLSILVDRAMGLFVLLCFSLVALSWLVPQIDRYPQMALLVRSFAIIFVILMLGGVVLLGMPYGRLPDRLQSLWLRIPRRQTIASLIAGLRSHLAQPRMTLAAVSLSVLVHLLVFAGAWCIARAIGLPANFTQVAVAVSVTVCLTSIPVSIGGHGVREGSFVLLFSALKVIDIRNTTGAGVEAAVLFSLLFFALLAAWGIPGGCLYLFGRRS